MSVIPTVRCSRLAVSLPFYTELLDFDVVARDPAREDPGFCVLSRGGDLLFLSSHAGDGPSGQAIAILVDDVDAVFRSLRARGLEAPAGGGSPVHAGPVDQMWGTREFFVDDPDGNTLRFIQGIGVGGGGPVRLDGVSPHFRVLDVVRTVEHYRDALGFEVVGYWDGERVHQDPGRPAHFGIVRRDRVSIHFNRTDAAPPPTDPAAGVFDIYLDVTGIDALAEEFRARGADLLDGPVDRAYGRRELVVRDPDGRVLAFGELG